MPFVRSVSSSELIRQWQEQQQQILEVLSPEARKAFTKYRKLDKLIRAVRAVEARREQEYKAGQTGSAEPPQASEGTGLAPPTSRVPLSIHKRKLIEFLRSHGPTTRGALSTETGIPAGSLSELLSGDEFEQVQRGFWALKGQVKKPGTSAQPGK